MLLLLLLLLKSRLIISTLNIKKEREKVGHNYWIKEVLELEEKKTKARREREKVILQFMRVKINFEKNKNYKSFRQN